MLNRVVRVRTRIATERFGREVKLNLSKAQDVVPTQNIGERATVMNATVRESLGEDEELRTCRLQACSYSENSDHAAAENVSVKINVIKNRCFIKLPPSVVISNLLLL